MDSITYVVPLLTLIVLETILGIDNVIFISILAVNYPSPSGIGFGTGVLAWPCSCGLAC